MSFISAASNNKCSVRLMPSEDGCFLLDIEHDRILKRNSVGAEIWGLLSDGEEESQIIQKLSHRYQVDEQRVAADVRAILAKIANFRLSPGSSIIADQLKLATPEKRQPTYPWYGRTAGEDHGPAPKSAVVLLAFIGLATFDLI